MAGDNYAQFVDYMWTVIKNIERHSVCIRVPAAANPQWNPMETYDGHEFLCRFRFRKSAVKKLLAVLPLQENTDGGGGGGKHCIQETHKITHTRTEYTVYEVRSRSWPERKSTTQYLTVLVDEIRQDAATWLRCRTLRR